MPSDFRRLLVARFLFTFGSQIQTIVLGWQMYVLTKDPLYLGLIGLVEAIPALGLALYAGYLVDRSNALIIYRGMLGVSLASATMMYVSQLETLSLDQEHRVTALFVSSFLTGIARAFSQPCIYAIVPKIVAKENLANATAWMTMSLQIARVSGPAVGGLLFGFVGVSLTGAIVASILFGAIIAPPKPSILRGHRSSIPKVHSLRNELLVGARFVFHHPILLPALSLDMISVLFGGVTALLPIFAAEVLEVGPTGLGFLRAAPAFGAACSSYWLTSKDIRSNAGSWLLVSVFGFGLCILVFSLSENYTLSFLMLGLSGVFDSVSMVIRSAAVQLASPEHMRGRISAVNSIFIGSSNELGEFESGVLASFIGAVPAAVVGGVLCLGTVAIVSAMSPALRRLDLTTLNPDTYLSARAKE